MKSHRAIMFLFSCVLACGILPGAIAKASEMNPQFPCDGSVADFADSNSVLRTPMPYSDTFITYGTARSATTGGFAYIYLKVNATIDAQNGHVMSIDGVWSYQADASRNFDRWEQLSLDYSKTSTSIWAKATGYVYFTGEGGFKDKYYIEVENTWYV